MTRPSVVDRNMEPIVRRRDNALFGRQNANAFIDYELKPGTLAYMCFAPPHPIGADEQGRIEIRINNHGLRDRTLAKRAPAGTHRVLCLGEIRKALSLALQVSLLKPVPESTFGNFRF